MRSALAGLTRRGQAFLLVGIAGVTTAVLSGQRDLLRVGIFLLALVAMSVGVVVRTRYRVASQRTLEPARTTLGSTTEVMLTLDNVSRLPTGLLLVEDRIPYALGPRPRFVLDRVEPRGTRHVHYPVRSDVRGKFSLGPLTLRLTDPFGMCELTRSFTAQDVLVVTPAVHPLPPVALGGEWAGNGESRSRSVAAAGEDDIATREYRHGDELRRVHWRSTARLGQLMVRREEQPWQSRATVLLDTRSTAHAGDGATSSFEWAVSAAASVSMHLVRRGYAVRLTTDTGSGTLSSAGREADAVGGDFEGMLLDSLAVAETSAGRTLRAASASVQRSGGDGLLVAVVGMLDLDVAGELVRLRSGTTTGVALLMNTSTWVALPPGVAEVRAGSVAAVCDLLRHAGWRVAVVSRGDTVAGAWERVARHLQTAAAAVAR